jgi:hypothetical protein
LRSDETNSADPSDTSKNTTINPTNHSVFICRVLSNSVRDSKIMPIGKGLTATSRTRVAAANRQCRATRRSRFASAAPASPSRKPDHRRPGASHAGLHAAGPRPRQRLHHPRPRARPRLDRRYPGRRRIIVLGRSRLLVLGFF